VSPLVWACLSSFVLHLGFGVVLPWSPELVGTSDAATALAASALVYAVAKLLIQVPAGTAVDRYGASRWLAPSLLVYAVSLLLMVLGHPIAFFAGRALEGLATGVAYVAILAVVAEGDRDRVGERIGKVLGVGAAGVLAGPVLALVAGGGGPLIPVALAAGAALFVALTAPRLAGQRVPPPTRHERSALLRAPLFLALLMPILFGKLSLTALQGILPLHGPVCCERDPQGVALWMLLLGVAFGIAQPLGGWLSDRVSARAVITSTWPMALIGLCAVGWMYADAPTTGALLTYAFFQSLAFAATMRALLHERWPVGRGSVLGIHAAITDLATLVGPSVFVFLYGRVAEVSLWGVAGIGALLWIAFWRLSAAAQRRAAEP
jgi:MFS family permease